MQRAIVKLCDFTKREMILWTVVPLGYAATLEKISFSVELGMEDTVIKIRRPDLRDALEYRGSEVNKLVEAIQTKLLQNKVIQLQ